MTLLEAASALSTAYWAEATHTPVNYTTHSQSTKYSFRKRIGMTGKLNERLIYWLTLVSLNQPHSIARAEHILSIYIYRRTHIKTYNCLFAQFANDSWVDFPRYLIVWRFWFDSRCVRTVSLNVDGEQTRWPLMCRPRRPRFVYSVLDRTSHEFTSLSHALYLSLTLSLSFSGTLSFACNRLLTALRIARFTRYVSEASECSLSRVAIDLHGKCKAVACGTRLHDKQIAIIQ